MRRALARATGALALVGLGCVDPFVLPLPPGADTAAGVIYVTRDRLLLQRDTAERLLLPGEPFTALVYPRAASLAALRSGTLLPGASRPCPLPEADVSFAWAPGDAGWSRVPNPPRVAGWFEAEPAEPVPLPIDSSCGEGNDAWGATREGCAIEIRTRSARLGVQRAGLGVSLDGRPTLELFTPEAFGSSCAPSPPVGAALATSRCQREDTQCYVDLLPARAVRTTSVELGPPEDAATTDPDLRLVPPFRFAYTGPALAGAHVWVGIGDPKSYDIHGCATGATLQRFDPDTLVAVGPRVPVPGLACLADLIPAPDGGLYVLGRRPPGAARCPVNALPAQAWALARVDADGRARAPVDLRPDFACLRVAVRSEVDADGRVLLGLANRSGRDMPGAGAAFVLDVDDGFISTGLDVTYPPPTSGATELAQLQPVAPGRWMMLGRGSEQFAVLEAETSSTSLQFDPLAPVPLIPRNTAAPRGSAYLPDVDRILAWPSGDASAATLLWSAEPVAAKPLLAPVSTPRTRRDVLAGFRWQLGSALPIVALLEISQEGDRQVRLVPVELVLSEARVRVAFEPVVVGAGAYHPTIAVDARSRVFVTLTWAGRLVRIDPPTP